RRPLPRCLHPRSAGLNRSAIRGSFSGGSMHSIPKNGWALVALAVAACGTEDAGGRGALSLTISGEEAAEVGFPVPGVEELAFADGWSVRFDKYLVGVGRVRVASADGAVAHVDDEVVVVDLTAGEQPIF